MGYMRGPQNRAHRRVLRSCQPRTRRERLFPWRPVENFLVPHAACPRAVMCQSFRKRACLIFGTRTIAGALCPKLPCDRCEMRSAHSRCRVSNSLITTVLVTCQDSGCRITRARRTYIHIRIQSRARARAVKTQPKLHAWVPRILGA